MLPAAVVEAGTRFARRCESMSSAEKIVAAALAVVLVVLVGAYFVTGRTQSASAGPGALQPAASGGPGEGEACAPGAAGGAAATQEFGEPGAKLDIIAVLPVTKGCHARTEAELKKAYEAHPDDIHLTVVDLMGPEAADYRDEVKVTWTVVCINGKSQFELGGRRVVLQQMEGNMYDPSDIVPIVEAELAAAG
jgi:hypothetical protein